MADYKEMYLHLFRETEKAIRILQQAHLDCEEIYISTPGTQSKGHKGDQKQLQEEKEAV